MNEIETVPELYVDQWHCHVSAYAWERDYSARYTTKMNLWFVSLVGELVEIRAIWARLLKGEVGAMTQPQNPYQKRLYCTLKNEPAKSWKMYPAHLPNATAHQLVLVPAAMRFQESRPDFVITPPTKDDAALMHYRFLDQRTPIPMSEQWADFLWERGLRNQEIVELESYGMIAYACKPNLEYLQRDISNGVRTGLLTIKEGVQ